jgi:hypothetical protein
MLWWLHYRENKSRSRKFPLSVLQKLFGRRTGDPSPFAFSTYGHLNTDCHIIPEDGVVAARMQMKPQIPQRVFHNREEALWYLDKVNTN